MPITSLEQEAIDFDWFGVDSEENIGHFASAGFGALPHADASTKADLLYIADLVKRSLRPISDVVVSDDLDARVHFRNALERERYLRSFMEFSSRGLFSHDCQTSGRRLRGYFLVTIPEKPLKLRDCPGDLRTLLEKTIFTGLEFRNASIIEPGQIIAMAG